MGFISEFKGLSTAWRWFQGSVLNNRQSRNCSIPSWNSTGKQV